MPVTAPENLDELAAMAAGRIARASALVVTAGAGMGVDSGMPDFRGPEGFWRAYPAYQKLGLGFEDLANPQWFEDDPHLAWGFYGHRLNLYRKTKPHAGFHVLRRVAARMAHGAFVFTSNVDGHFQAAGFHPDRVTEVHGAIRVLQCTRAKCKGLWDAPPGDIDIDPESFRAVGALPSCPRCGAVARPNILMFGDWGWDDSRSAAQSGRLDAWMSAFEDEHIVVIESGAGTAIPTVRLFGENLAKRHPGKVALIRLNVREPQVPAGHLGIAAGARAALEAIEAHLPPAGGSHPGA